MEQFSSPPTQVVIVKDSKSVALAFILAFFFGPLGLLYASVLGGIIMIILSVIMFIFLPIVGAVIAWVISLIWAVVAAGASRQKAYKVPQRL